MPTKTKKSVSKFLDSENNTKIELKGGLKPKDDPDKLDKEEFEENEEVGEVGEVEDVEVEVEGEEEEEEDEGEDEGEEEEEDDNENAEENVEEYDDECIYKLTKPGKKKKPNMNIDIDIEDNFEDEADEQINNKYVKPSERKTKPYLFEFERVRLLGDRARQLSMGAKPMIKNIEVMDPRSIAKMELEKKVIPLIILRELPNGLIEKWKVSELNFF